MNTRADVQDTTFIRHMVQVKRVILTAAALIALTTLAAWLMPGLGQHIPAGWEAMKANTAAGILVAVASLWLSTEDATGMRLVISRAFALLLLLLASATLLEYLLDTPFGIDTWLVRGAIPASPGRTSPEAVVVLLLIGAVLPGTRAGRGAVSLIVDILVLVIGLYVLVLFAGVVFGGGRTGPVHPDVPLQTVISLGLLAFVLIGRRTRHGVFKLLAGTGIGSRIARATAPFMLMLPFLIEWGYRSLTRIEILGGADLSVIEIVFTAALLFFVVLALAHRINGLEDQIRRLLQERADAELKQSEARYTQLVEQAITGIIVRRQNGEIVLVNPAYCQLTGYSRTELLHMNAAHLVADADPTVLPRTEALKPGQSLRLETSIRRKDGSLVAIEAQTHRLDNGDLQTTAQDITERKRAETEMRLSAERFRVAVEAAPSGMLIVDERGTVTLVNSQIEKMLGFDRAELVGRNIEALVPERYRGTHPGQRGAYWQTPEARPMGAGRDLYAQHKDGREIPVEIGLSPMATSEGRFVLASIVDISERKEAEMRIRVFADELQSMSRRLVQAHEDERRAIARELHDQVGQMLTAMTFNLRRLEQSTDLAETRQLTKETGSLLADLMHRVRSMSLNLRPSILDDLGLGPAIQWYMREQVEKGGLKVELNLPTDLPRFQPVIETTVFRILQEAATNTLRHAKASRIEVRLEVVDKQLDLSVADDGQGFDVRAAQVHASAGNSLGVLGMDERARLAGGRLDIRSAPDSGTAVRLTLKL